MMVQVPSEISTQFEKKEKNVVSRRKNTYAVATPVKMAESERNWTTHIVESTQHTLA